MSVKINELCSQLIAETKLLESKNTELQAKNTELQARVNTLMQEATLSIQTSADAIQRAALAEKRAQQLQETLDTVLTVLRKAEQQAPAPAPQQAPVALAPKVPQPAAVVVAAPRDPKLVEELAGYDAKLKDNPKHATTHFQRAGVLYKLGDYNDAKASIKLAEENGISKENQNLPQLKAKILTKLNENKEALAIIQEAIKKSNAKPSNKINIGINYSIEAEIYKAMGDIAKAKESAAKAKENGTDISRLNLD
jgi:tetratricopeptide (TPR) repeat protein